jgi:hypothetical protein
LLLLSLIRHIESKQNYRWSWLVGLLLGLGAGIRPYTFFLLAFPILIYFAAAGKKNSKFGYLGAMVGAGTLTVAVLFAYNHYLTGAWFDFAYWQSLNSEKLTFAGFSAEGFVRLAEMLGDTSKWLFAWGMFQSGNLKQSLPGDINLSVFLLMAAIGMGIRNCLKGDGPSRLFLSLICVQVLGHIFYLTHGGRFGERFFFEITFLIMLFFCQFLIHMAQIFKTVADGYGMKLSRNGIALGFVALIFLPNIQVRLANTVDDLHNANLLRMDIFLKAGKMNLTNAIVFVADVPEFEPSFYARNEPDLRGNLFVQSISGSNELLRKIFPSRKAYIYRLGAREYSLEPIN